jgi:hypothetical protein
MAAFRAPGFRPHSVPLCFIIFRLCFALSLRGVPFGAFRVKKPELVPLGDDPAGGKSGHAANDSLFVVRLTGCQRGPAPGPLPSILPAAR